jgi:hypothetical protein
MSCTFPSPHGKVQRPSSASPFRDVRPPASRAGVGTARGLCEGLRAWYASSGWPTFSADSALDLSGEKWKRQARADPVTVPEAGGAAACGHKPSVRKRLSARCQGPRRRPPATGRRNSAAESAGRPGRPRRSGGSRPRRCRGGRDFAPGRLVLLAARGNRKEAGRRDHRHDAPSGAFALSLVLQKFPQAFQGTDVTHLDRPLTDPQHGRNVPHR